VVKCCRRSQWAQWTVVLVIAAVGAGCARKQPPQGRAEAEKLLGKAVAAYQGLQTFSERTTIRMRGTYSGETASDVTTTHFQYQRPNMIYYEVTGRSPSVWVSDGRHLITYSPESNSYWQTDAPVDLADFFRMKRFRSPGLNELALIAGRQPKGILSNLRLGKPARLSGVETRPISGDIVSLPNAGEGVIKAQQTLWIDTKTYAVRRNLVVVKRKDETSRWDETMDEVELNPKLAGDRFQWSPPPGARRTSPRARPSLRPPQRP
jgi:outer membrane lipoprotein-sorting protein